jgi:hypothetical protein
MKFRIVLRDLEPKQIDFVVESYREIDYEKIDPQEDPPEDAHAEGAITEFLGKVAALEFKPGQEHDIFITWFEDQGEFELPVALLKLCGERGWPITVSLND